jgi:hypothetical protein
VAHDKLTKLSFISAVDTPAQEPRRSCSSSAPAGEASGVARVVKVEEELAGTERFLVAAGWHLPALWSLALAAGS